MLAPGPRPTAPGSGSEFSPWNAQPVDVNTTQQPTAKTRRAKLDGPAPPRAERPHRRRAATRAITVVARLPATAFPTPSALARGASASTEAGGMAAPGTRAGGTAPAGPTGSPGRPV